MYKTYLQQKLLSARKNMHVNSKFKGNGFKKNLYKNCQRELFH